MVATIDVYNITQPHESLKKMYSRLSLPEGVVEELLVLLLIAIINAGIRQASPANTLYIATGIHY